MEYSPFSDLDTEREPICMRICGADTFLVIK